MLSNNEICYSTKNPNFFTAPVASQLHAQLHTLNSYVRYSYRERLIGLEPSTVLNLHLLGAGFLFTLLSLSSAQLREREERERPRARPGERKV